MRRYGLSVVCEPPEMTGVATYASELARAMAPLLEADERLVVIRHHRFARPVRHARVEDVRLFVPVGRSSVRRVLEQVVVPVAGLLRRLDLLHAVNHVLPLAWPGRAVLTVHDARLYRGRQEAGLARWLFRAVIYPESLRRADEVLAVSATAAKEIAAALGVADGRLRVIPHGVDGRFAGAAAARALLAGTAAEGRPYLLHVGQHEPHKNLPRLLAALAAALEGGLSREGKRPALVLAGSRGADSGAVEARIAELRLGRDVARLGYVAAEALPGLYAGACALAYPSVLEGFGLPPVEAMAAGLPVLAGDIPVLRETLGDAALFVAPLDEAAIALGLTRIVADDALRADLVTRGRARAAGYTWRRTAERTLAVYRGLVPARKRRSLG